MNHSKSFTFVPDVYNSPNCVDAFKLKKYSNPLLSHSQLSFLSCASVLNEFMFLWRVLRFSRISASFLLLLFSEYFGILKIIWKGREETRLATRLFDLDLLFLHSTKVSKEMNRRRPISGSYFCERTAGGFTTCRFTLFRQYIVSNRHLFGVFRSIVEVYRQFPFRGFTFLAITVIAVVYGRIIYVQHWRCVFIVISNFRGD